MPEINHTDAYYFNSDIDWFCRINGVNIHVASMGHRLPREVETTLEAVYEQVPLIEMAPWGERQGVWYNEDLVRRVLRKATFTQEGEEIQEADDMEVARYLATFIVMARKGFYSFAPLTIDPTDKNYYLMAKPMDYVERNIQGIYMRDIEGVNVRDIDGQTPLFLEEIL
ncbi:MAG: hypothetical protein J6Y32_08845 [Bacteroidales bacterium]|nr:hypothetical protein [Bacteroidales bacterium]